MLSHPSEELSKFLKAKKPPQYNLILVQVSEVEAWKGRKGALRQRPADFDPSRYISFSTREVVEEPVASEHIHDYVDRSRLSRRLGW